VYVCDVYVGYWFTQCYEEDGGGGRRRYILQFAIHDVPRPLARFAACSLFFFILPDSGIFKWVVG
jgi:hypothetical protein